MQPHTHRRLDPELCGAPVHLDDGVADVELVATDRMRADDHGLVHGGFVFGLADHAAMLAVNRETVVLGSADLRFVAPVRVGERLVAHAQVREMSGQDRNKKYLVDVEVKSENGAVLTGSFTCFVPAQHVLTEVGDARR
jgi:uncharacterized protein (TIGR00369 family)